MSPKSLLYKKYWSDDEEVFYNLSKGNAGAY